MANQGQAAPAGPATSAPQPDLVKLLAQFKAEQEATQARFAAAEARTAAVAEDLSDNSALLQAVMGSVNKFENTTSARMDTLDNSIKELNGLIKGLAAAAGRPSSD